MQQTTTIEVSMNNCFNHFNNNNNDGEQRMTSLEIAELTGKQHKDVLKAIRTMEPAWVKVQGRNFSLLQKTYNLPNGGTKMMPYYSLTKTECLYIATKFNDEARARLVIRWEELERERFYSHFDTQTIIRSFKNFLEERALIIAAHEREQR